MKHVELGKLGSILDWDYFYNALKSQKGWKIVILSHFMDFYLVYLYI